MRAYCIAQETLFDRLWWPKWEVQCCKEQYCLGSWNVRSMNQGKFSSIQFHRSLVSDSLRPHELSIESVMPSNHLILCHPLPLLPSIFPSIRVFSGESALHIRWPQYWSLGFIISASNEYSGLICSRVDWFNLLAVQGTLKNLLQHEIRMALMQYKWTQT